MTYASAFETRYKRHKALQTALRRCAVRQNPENERKLRLLRLTEKSAQHLAELAMDRRYCDLHAEHEPGNFGRLFDETWVEKSDVPRYPISEEDWNRSGLNELSEMYSSTTLSDDDRDTFLELLEETVPNEALKEAAEAKKELVEDQNLDLDSTEL